MQQAMVNWILMRAVIVQVAGLLVAGITALAGGRAWSAPPPTAAAATSLSFSLWLLSSTAFKSLAGVSPGAVQFRR